MFNKLKAFLAPPVFEHDLDKTATARITNTVLLVMMFMSTGGAILALMFGDPSYRIPAAASSSSAVGMWIGFFFLIRKGYVRLVNILLVIINFSILAFVSAIVGGITHPAVYLGLIISALAMLLLTGWEIAGVTVLNVIMIVTLYILEIRGLVPHPTQTTSPEEGLRLFLFTVISTGALLQVAATVLRNSIRRARESEARVTATNQELQQLNQELEKRVDERTSELRQRSEELEQINTRSQRRVLQFQAIAEVSRSIASLQDLKALLSRVTYLVSEQFAYYHVGIFLNDETNENAILMAANSDGGKRMIQRKHRLQVGKVGIVGFVTGTGKPRIALDTGADAVFFNNPDLPETRSEMALPLTSGEKIIGALDVQSRNPGAFTRDDIDVLAILAELVSIAIVNSRLFESTQKSLAEAETVYRQYLQREWSRLVEEQQLVGLRYTLSGTATLDRPLDQEGIREVFDTGEPFRKSAGINENFTELAVPIKLRGEIIGVLNVTAPADYEWNPDQVDLVRAVTDRLAISLENARLLDETTKRADRERTVSEITTRIRQNTDPQVMLQAAIDELKHVLGTDDIQVRPFTRPSTPPAVDSQSAANNPQAGKIRK